MRNVSVQEKHPSIVSRGDMQEMLPGSQMEGLSKLATPIEIQSGCLPGGSSKSGAPNKITLCGIPVLSAGHYRIP